MFLTDAGVFNKKQVEALSQSPQIGSMFLTNQIIVLTTRNLHGVAIPSNRVNVSYVIAHQKKSRNGKLSQSPQIGSMFLTWQIETLKRLLKTKEVAIPSNRVNVSYAKANPALAMGTVSQSPQIGSMFLTGDINEKGGPGSRKSRNPLKSGQCFLQLC